jgi:ATP phosphoribosyltransferase
LSQLTIAIPRGRLEREALNLFALAGIRVITESNSRCLTRTDESEIHQFIFVKPADIPVYVEHGIADGGIVGLDVLLATAWSQYWVLSDHRRCT